MTLWHNFKRLLTPSETRIDQTFSLGDRGSQPDAEERGPVLLKDARIRTEGVMTRIDNLLEAQPEGKKAVEQTGDLTDSLDENVRRLKALFHMPPNKDLVVRDLTIATQPPTRAVAFFMEGLSDKMAIIEGVLKPLMLLTHLDHHLGEQGEEGKTEFSVKAVIERMLPGHQVAEQYDMKSVAQFLLSGDTLLFFEGARTAVSVETKSPPVRSIPEAKNEQTVMGPHDAFNEAWRVNVALVRRRLKDPRLLTEILTVGEVSSTFVGLMYIEGITSPKLVAEARRRVEDIKVDAMTGAGMLEQFIEDNPFTLMPGVLTTERPDRVAAYLAEGHVALFVDTSPYAIIAPATFWAQLQTAEDYYLRYPFGSLIRYIRFTGLILAVTVPAFYIALVNYHQEMLPTQLMMFIASTREGIPMPAALELILMDLSFELIREAGVRIPNVIGPTMGLVASLVLGQAAVGAKIVSPLLVVIVAITGLSSFVIPNYLTSYGVRALRFLFLAAGALMGFYGIGVMAFCLTIHLAGQRSFGVPFLSPVAPARNPACDVINRPELFEMEMRPSYVRPLERRRQSEIVRAWDPYAPKPSETEGSQGGENA